MSTWLATKLTNAKLFIIYKDKLFPDVTGEGYKFSPFGILLEVPKIPMEGWQEVLTM